MVLGSSCKVARLGILIVLIQQNPDRLPWHDQGFRRLSDQNFSVSGMWLPLVNPPDFRGIWESRSMLMTAKNNRRFPLLGLVGAYSGAAGPYQPSGL